MLKQKLESVIKTIIVGFGHCGRNLHLRCMRKLLAQPLQGRVDEVIDVVDPHVSRDEAGTGGALRFHASLPPATQFAGQVPVVHICTPPGCHLENIQQALNAGYRYIILEKPMAPGMDDARLIRQLAQQANATVLVVAVWMNSALTSAIRRELGKPENHGYSSIDVVHNKARFSRTLARHNEHVFDIEMPHQLSVVLPLLGQEVHLLNAHTHDLMVNGDRRATMSRGEITLMSRDGVMARLISNLNHPVRERSISIQFKGGHKLVGNFPVSSDDSYSQLFLYSSMNLLTAHEVFHDEPLTRCLQNYYDYFIALHAGGTPPLPEGASPDFNLQVVSLLDQAKQHQVQAVPSAPVFNKPVGSRRSALAMVN